MRALWMRIAATVRRGPADADLADELANHLEMLADEFEEQGMSRRDALAAARREFGAVDSVKEAYRDRRGFPLLESFVQDVRYGLRSLIHARAFTAAAVISLALGIGANTAVFSLFYALMLKTLPVRNPQQLVTLYRTGGWGNGYMSYPLYQDLRERTDIFEGVLARSGAEHVRFSVTAADRPEFVEREFVSGNYFSLLGIPPALGRVFSDADSRTPRGHPLAVLSYDFWRNRFGGDPGIIGRTVRVDEQLLTVTGVAAPGFRGVSVEERPDVWVPLMMARGDIAQAGRHWLWAVGRRHNGVSEGHVRAVGDTVMRRYLEAHFAKEAGAFHDIAMAQRLEVRPGSAGISILRERFAKPLAILLGVVALVLIAACANVANLLLARGAARRHETAMRISLGASRARLIRQWLVECSLLGAFGMLLGVALGYWATDYVFIFVPEAANNHLSVAPDKAVLAFTAVLSFVCVLLFGVAPALRSTDVKPGADLNDRRATKPALRRSIVVAQVAVSVVLVAVAGLFARSLAGLRSQNLGFTNQNVLSFSLDFPQSYNDDAIDRVRRDLRERISSTPGVLSASYGFPGPYQRGSWFTTVRVPGSRRTAHQDASVDLQALAPRYFETIGARPRRGREFDESDGARPRRGREFDESDSAGSPRVAIVNEAFAREFLEGGDPVGRTLTIEADKPVAIVGEVADMLHHGLREHAVSTVYLPVAQNKDARNGFFFVRSALPPASIIPELRREVAATDPSAVLIQPATIRELIDDSISVERLLTAVSCAFGVLALVLAVVGLYGVIAFGMAQRTKEIGIRLALGAARSNVLGMVMKEALLMIVTGAAIGIPLAIAASRVGSSLLFGIKPGDAATLTATVLILVACGTAAAFVPARRAASIAPTEALRHE